MSVRSVVILFACASITHALVSHYSLCRASRLETAFREELFYEKQAPLLRHHLDGGTLTEVSESLAASEWNRYIFLREFLDYVPKSTRDGDEELEYMGKTSWSEMSHAFALMLGYREQADGRVTLQSNLVPDSWRDLSESESIPSITVFEDFVDFKLSKDLPDGEEGTQLVLQILGGMEMSKLMQQAADKGAVEIRRKLLLVQWLYVYDFLGSEFPPKDRAYVPYHLRDGEEDEDWDGSEYSL